MDERRVVYVLRSEREPARHYVGLTADGDEPSRNATSKGEQRSERDGGERRFPKETGACRLSRPRSPLT
jgi:hypothetical protein